MADPRVTAQMTLSLLLRSSQGTGDAPIEFIESYVSPRKVDTEDNLGATLSVTVALPTAGTEFLYIRATGGPIQAIIDGNPVITLKPGSAADGFFISTGKHTTLRLINPSTTAKITYRVVALEYDAD